MSEKVKGMFGNPERAEEVREWLLSQGAINDTQVKCDDVHSIYYVDNSKMKTLFSLYGAYDALFDIVELTKLQLGVKPFDKVLVKSRVNDLMDEIELLNKQMSKPKWESGYLISKFG